MTATLMNMKLKIIAFPMTKYKRNIPVYSIYVCKDTRVYGIIKQAREPNYCRFNNLVPVYKGHGNLI